MRRWLIVLAILITLTISNPAQAKDPVTIQTLEVDIWPEYDQPSVLVIYRITLSPQTKLPAEMVVRIPRSAGVPSAIAEQTANGLFNLSYSAAGEEGDWLLFSFTTTLPQIQLEYYDSNLLQEGDSRNYVYRWPGDYPVENMSIIVQQPRTATSMRLLPNTGVSGPGNDGLTYFNVPVGDVSEGSTFDLQVTYVKTDNILTQSQAFEAVTPAAPVNRSTPGRVTLNQVIPWVLGGLGVLLIGIGTIWYIRTGRQPLPTQTRRHKPTSEARSATAEDTQAVFCHQCGKRAAPGDVFCRICGTKLRK